MGADACRGSVDRVSFGPGAAKVKRVLAVAILGTLFGVAVITARPQTEEPGLKSMHVKAPEFPPPASELPPVPGERTAGRQQSTEPGQGAVAEPSGPEAQAPGVATTGVTWINSRPLTMEDLQGKVVLIDFWEYTCINCIRTFPDNKKWWDRYHKYGFEIIGVHDPEFDIAYRVANVRAADKRFQLPYPIVVDDHFRIWQSYYNNTWPNRFLIDAKGFIRYNRSGEGADDSFERAIQELLKEAHPGLSFPAGDTISPERDAFAPDCGVPTPEMYVGDWGGRGILSNAEGYHDGKTLDYKLPPSVDDGHAAVEGRWQTDKSGMIYRGKHKGSEPGPDHLIMRYHARELYAVLNVSHGHPERLYIQQDGKDLTKADKGVDVQFDAQGHSYLEVREPRMYYLVQNPEFGSHTVELFPTAPGLTVNSFTFGNNCQTDFAHL
jgi:alkyl hydroperoxide reductase subunit AhpC